MFCGLGRLFFVSNLSSDFSVVGFHSPSLMLLFFFSCFLWYMCVELVFWCFGLFYSEFCGSSLAWAPCMWLFCLWGDSYLLAGGCALFMCFPASWWLWSGEYSFSILFWYFGLVLDRVHLCFRLLLSKCYYSILFFLCDCGDLSLDYVSYSSYF